MADGEPIPATGPPPPMGGDIDPVTGQPQTQGFKEWFKSHETLSLVIGAGVLLLTAILVFRKNQTSGSNTGTPSGDLAPQSTDTSGQTDNSGALAAALNNLMNWLAAHSGDQAPPTNPAPPKPQPPIPPSPPPVPIGNRHRMPPVPVSVPPRPGPTPVAMPPGPRPKMPPIPASPVRPRLTAGQGGTGDALSTDYPTVAQWTPDNAPIQQSLSNITNGETSGVTRVENALSGQNDGINGPTDPMVPSVRAPWRPVPLGVPFSVPVSPAGPGAGHP